MNGWAGNRHRTQRKRPYRYIGLSMFYLDKRKQNGISCPLYHYAALPWEHASRLGCSPPLWGLRTTKSSGWLKIVLLSNRSAALTSYPYIHYGRQDPSWTPAWAWNRIILDAPINRKDSEELRAVWLEMRSNQRPLLNCLNCSGSPVVLCVTSLTTTHWGLKGCSGVRRFA